MEEGTVEKNSMGTLYLCATPIGNLEDMTFRAVRVMKEVPLIAAEDTRHTRKLLTHYDVHTPLTSYHEHNKFEKGPELIAHLCNGQELLLVSDAGLPGIADPGSHLVMLAIEAGITITPLPGANAALSALICSGIDTTKFLFLGFLPKTTKKRREVLAEFRTGQETMILYESPHRLKTTLAELSEAFGPDRRAVAARELTKKFEEFVRGTLGELSAYFEANQPRGEFCLVLEGSDTCVEEEPSEMLDPVSLVRQLMAQGMEKKAAMKQTAQKLNMSRRDVYQAILAAEE